MAAGVGCPVGRCSCVGNPPALDPAMLRQRSAGAVSRACAHSAPSLHPHAPLATAPAPAPQPARSCVSSPSQSLSCRHPTTTAAWARTRPCGRCRSTGGAMSSWMSADRCAQRKEACLLCFTARHGSCRPALKGASRWHAVGQRVHRQSSFLHVLLAAPPPSAGHPRLR